MTGPAGNPDNADASTSALYRVFGTVGGANDPTADPTAGRFAHVNVVSDQELGANDTTYESAEPAAASVVVRTDNDAPVNVVPAGADGRVNFRYAVNDDDPPRAFIEADVPRLVFGDAWAAYVSSVGDSTTV